MEGIYLVHYEVNNKKKLSKMLSLENCRELVKQMKYVGMCKDISILYKNPEDRLSFEWKIEKY